MEELQENVKAPTKPKKKAKPKAAQPRKVSVAQVKNVGKFFKRHPSGIKLGVGETKELPLDAWVKANAEAGSLVIGE